MKEDFKYDIFEIMENMDTARIYSGSVFGRLCNENKHIDACIFQSIRDSLAQNIQLLKSYMICKEEEV